ncbi:3-demethylubiquinone-9 3-methyltransferase [Rhizobiales bacterium GAS188]|nr:3-demethylubiquinone-9 3-methyltransferase [Rhizobiales bacterium GAS188]
MRLSAFAIGPGRGYKGRMQASTIDPAEIARFERLASTWWEPEGPMRALHAMNPARLSWIRDQVVAHFGRDAREVRAFAGLSAIDIGCGGGLLSEPLARLGARVTGIDPAAENIGVARRHAEGAGLSIDYRVETVEKVAEAGGSFDIVFAMEVVEHVADVQAFIGACERVLKPGGLLLMSTLNRTLRSFALAIVGAEYVLRWLPRGTHRWDKFLTPEELADEVEGAGLETVDVKGLVFDPLRFEWRRSRDKAVNYVLAARKAAA